MRKSRVLLAGVAVAAAAAATSAFTASNTFGTGVQNTVVGYGEATVSGANITAIHYNRSATDQNVLAEVVWETDSNLSALTASDAKMTLKNGTTVLNTGSPYACTIAVGTPTTITCTVGNVAMDGFTKAGLSVGNV
ncbi:MAG: hypothetical protein JWQ99_2537 [Blastococcus sp.]|jgi:hypothetical protein|nr:hypothetical protein [Blastococcus sp.]